MYVDEVLCRERPANVARIHPHLARAWQMLIRLRAAEALLIAQRIEQQIGSLPGAGAGAVRWRDRGRAGRGALAAGRCGAALAARLSALRLDAATPAAHVA